MSVEYTQFDRNLAENGCFLQLGDPANKNNIEFQFPPKVLSDGRKGTWNEGEQRGTEPFAVFATSGPREISLSWTYLVDGGKWSIQRVATQINRVRSYFALVRIPGPDVRNLIVTFRYHAIGGNPWLPGGDISMTCRIKSIDVKHGDTLVADDCGNYVAFPLRSDITIDLRIWTKGATTGPPVQFLQDLRRNEEVGWY